MSRKRKDKSESVFQKNFNQVLRERGISLKMASELMKLPYSTVADWANNGTSPNNLEAIGLFCKQLGISFEWLILNTHSSLELSEIPIEQIFDEDTNSSFDGYYKVQMRRLIPKSKKKKSTEV